jgi:hypothetical protein
MKSNVIDFMRKKMKKVLLIDASGFIANYRGISFLSY